jgi:hypothetical protein
MLRKEGKRMRTVRSNTSTGNDYTELANGRIGPKRVAVVSQCKDGTFTIGQQLEVDDDGKVMKVFLKGALHVSSREGLQNLRDALNKTLQDLG